MSIKDEFVSKNYKGEIRPHEHKNPKDEKNMLGGDAP